MGKIVKKLLKLLAYFYGLYWRILNYRKPKVFVYTDSRGFEITKWYNRFSPWNSYIGMLCRNYNVTFVIQPEKHTTIFDFLESKEHLDIKRFSTIILHCGVVDFSPRPYDDYLKVAESKKDRIIRLFGGDYWASLIARESLGSVYYGQRTLPLVDEMLARPVFDRLEEIENLLWIPSNRVLSDWRGNYWRDRPSDINLVWSTSSSLVTRGSIRFIDNLSWSDEEVKLYTVDNIHFSQAGMHLLFNEIKSCMDES